MPTVVSFVGGGGGVVRFLCVVSIFFIIFGVFLSKISKTLSSGYFATCVLYTHFAGSVYNLDHNVLIWLMFEFVSPVRLRQPTQWGTT